MPAATTMARPGYFGPTKLASACSSAEVAAQAEVHHRRHTQSLGLLEDEARRQNDVGVLDGAVGGAAHARAEDRRFGGDADVFRRFGGQAVAGGERCDVRAVAENVVRLIARDPVGDQRVEICVVVDRALRVATAAVFFFERGLAIAGRSRKIHVKAHSRSAVGRSQIAVPDVEPGIDDADHHAFAAEAGGVAKRRRPDPALRVVEQGAAPRRPVQLQLRMIVDERRQLARREPDWPVTPADQELGKRRICRVFGEQRHAVARAEQRRRNLARAAMAQTAQRAAELELRRSVRRE